MKVAKLGLSAILGIAMTVGLLTLMFTLIEMGEIKQDEKEQRKIGDIWQEDQVIEDNVKKLDFEKPEDPQEPPPLVPQDTMELEDVAEAVQIDAPIMDTAGALNIGSGFSGDGEYIPLVKILPQYPRRAAERGVEGHVIVVFTITTTGSITNARVLEGLTSKGKPTKMFDRAALNAANKLKYKPRVIDGTAVEVEGVQHKFTFQLEKD